MGSGRRIVVVEARNRKEGRAGSKKTVDYDTPCFGIPLSTSRGHQNS